MIDADALDTAQPLPWKATSFTTSPSSCTYTVT